MADAAALIDWIHSLRTMGEKAELRNMRRLLAALGQPQHAFRAVHVAGTNGKGSVCKLLEGALRANGYTTGLYTSPFLEKYNERICLNGAPISDETLLRLGNRVRAAVGVLQAQGVRPTTFEVGTAIAFLAFAETKVDFAVVEVGLGGRLDPTNVLVPELCVITTIALDHMEILGDTIEAIAREKAGIIKENVPVVLYPQCEAATRAIEEIARLRHARVVHAANAPIANALETATGASFDIALPSLGRMHVQIALAGAHQLENARLTLMALDTLAALGVMLAPEAVQTGMRLTRWPGRLEYLASDCLIDGAHNPQGVKALAQYLRRWRGERRIVLLSAMMREKQPRACAEILAPLIDTVIATQVDWPRALDCETLAGYYRDLGCTAYALRPVADALDALYAYKSDDTLLVVAGSLYLIGAVRARIGAPTPDESNAIIL